MSFHLRPRCDGVSLRAGSPEGFLLSLRRNLLHYFEMAHFTLPYLQEAGGVIANALLFAHVLTTERIPQAIAEQIVAMGMAPWQFLIVVNILLLVAGNFMEPTGIILILAPILFPIATQLGIDPVHLGIIMTVNLEIGMVTPPVGLNLFVTAGITRMSIVEVVRAALPWLSVLLVFLIIITYIPQITLFLPNLLF